jgi:hypothetical protein
MNNNNTNQKTPLPYQSDMPWLRLFTLSTGDPLQIHYLEKALQANPHNKQTLRLIERLDPQRARTWATILTEQYGPP